MHRGTRFIDTEDVKDAIRGWDRGCFTGKVQCMVLSGDFYSRKGRHRGNDCIIIFVNTNTVNALNYLLKIA